MSNAIFVRIQSEKTHMPKHFFNVDKRRNIQLLISTIIGVKVDFGQ